jgi:hypothetical protein
MFKIIIGVASFVALVIVYIKYSTSPTTISSTPQNSPSANAQTQNVDIPFKSLTLDRGVKAMTVKNIGQNAGDPVVLFKNWASPHQRVLYQNNLIKFKHSNKCLSTLNKGMTEGTLLVQDSCQSSNIAKWSQQSNGQISLVGSNNLCITADPTLGDDKQLYLSSCESSISENQKWRYEN